MTNILRVLFNVIDKGMLYKACTRGCPVDTPESNLRCATRVMECSEQTTRQRVISVDNHTIL